MWCWSPLPPVGLATSGPSSPGAEAFALLIDKLPAEELNALATLSTALEHLLQLDEKQRDSASWQADEPPVEGCHEQGSEFRRESIPPTEGRLGGCSGLRCLLHGHRPGPPILPALSKQLNEFQVGRRPFTNYLWVMALAMLVTGRVSSWIGSRRTLIIGLTLIVVFTCRPVGRTINQMIGSVPDGAGQRALHRHVLRSDGRIGNWGLPGAIFLDETALGVGIALGPLIGGELGAISWRGPFYGVTVLMGISLVATIAFVQGTPRSAHPTSILEPIRALRHRGLATMSVTALFYNWGFFTLLAYTPFLMHLSIHQLGYVFTCWGILVAIFAVFVAPRAQRHFGTPKTLDVNLSLLAADLLVIALFPSSRTTLIVAVIVSGAFIGLNNTLTTQAVMLVSPVEKPIASASYGFVRFIGGGLAPYCASKLAIAFNVSLPFYVAAGSVVIGILVLATGHTLLTDAEKNPAEELVDPTSASEPTPLRRVTTIAPELVSSVGNIAPTVARPSSQPSTPALRRRSHRNCPSNWPYYSIVRRGASRH